MNKKALIALFILALININAANAQEIAEGKIVPVNNTSEYSAQGSQYYNNGVNFLKSAQYTNNRI